MHKVVSPRDPRRSVAALVAVAVTALGLMVPAGPAAAVDDEPAAPTVERTSVTASGTVHGGETVVDLVELAGVQGTPTPQIRLGEDLPDGFTFDGRVLRGTSTVGLRRVLPFVAHNPLDETLSTGFTVTLEILGPPVVHLEAPATVAAYTPVEIPVTVTGWPASRVEGSDLPSFLHLTEQGDGTWLLEGTPTHDHVGTHRGRITFYNGYDWTWALFEITVTVPLPVVLVTADPYLAVGSSAQWQIEVAGLPDTTPADYSVTLRDAPAWAGVERRDDTRWALLVDDPPLGTHTLTAVATKGAVSIEQSLSFTVPSRRAGPDPRRSRTSPACRPG